MYSYSRMLFTTDTHKVLYLAYKFRWHNQVGKTKREGGYEMPNGRKIVLRFNNAKQAIGNEAGLLSGVLGLLGSDFGKFHICEESWHNANDVDSVDQEADDSFVDSRAQNHKGRKTTEFWKVRIIDNYYIWLIDSDGTIKLARLSVREAMEWPNGRKIVLRFNNAKQAIENEAGMLSGVLGLLGSDFGKFSICEESWHSEGTIKKNILKSMGKSWKETRLRLYNTYFEPTFTTEQNIEYRPPGIDRECWRWFLDYHAKAETKDQ
ncbi:hypothetical protein AHAS_Ahas09G0208600 [Arachis hypogaea]